MAVRIAINGLGRIGRLTLRQIIHHPGIELVAVNDLVDVDHLAYMIKFDSTHGRIEAEVHVEQDKIVIDGTPIKVLCEKNPQNLPWKELKIDYVIESTGLFTSKEKAEDHLKAGAKRVIISAPAKGEVATYVMGVNHLNYNPSSDYIVSNASCTTNCVAPLAKVLLDNFGIEEGLMTTIHAMTAAQPTVDAPSKKDWRGGRGAHQNIIPSSTGAAKAVGLCLPELKGKLTGMAFRVPVPNVSAVDLTVRLSKSTTYQQICEAMKNASEGSMKGFLYYCEDEVVSTDFNGSTYSANFDAKAGIGLNDQFFKIVAWYDNEVGYSARIVDLIDYMAKQEKRT